ncbi:LEAF RUST 10 DISEASE-RESISTANCEUS RECEPTOR-LIKE PROTEIN KINASE-like 1.2 [Rutidosis leptorrhynchoides]|uniref:LEAF RUST 10 DISEASE-RESISTANCEUS RECEPTOR-LIKE PROTEIN KINASE-like 1.2 n=1 Tax=Rutidosis leptorrhynchoides TaxID=125765 RepID=UPI003A991B28
MKNLKRHASIILINPIISITFFILFNQSFSLDRNYELCVPKDCGDGQSISYPFYIKGLQDSSCGNLGFELLCNVNGSATIQIFENNYTIKDIQYESNTFRLENTMFVSSLSCKSRLLLKNVTSDSRFVIDNDQLESKIILLSKCSNNMPSNLDKYKIKSCDDDDKYAMLNSDVNYENVARNCGEIVETPVDTSTVVDGGNIMEMVKRGFLMRWLAADCGECKQSGGRCGLNTTNLQFRCFCPDRPHKVSCKPVKDNRKRIIIAALVGSALIFAFAGAIFFIRRTYKRKAFAYFSSKDKSRDLEDVSVYFGVSVFSYSELEDATNHFDSAQELGNGGFGTVYYGKLRDGREVAVKRLYEHNYKRVQQFMNEVEILTRLRHKNLVSLYGCTSRKSRELLLVYEYIDNGTVADHLHGDRAQLSALTWQNRMKIAIETASALAYLHASDIIHRDVKTNNILLDNTFCVKVADFGLSRLLPNDMTHVSTAPQGTPGYVDPEYHQIYQLTDKSDVYSFGVVLIELISSMPAIDISRSREEISLANMAINRIQKCALDELIDPYLGSDEDTERMTKSVAELAFRCLQFDSETRPTMVEVLEILKDIQVEKGIIDDIEELNPSKVDVPPPHSPENEGAGLLKGGSITASPVSVTVKWHSTSSESTIPNIM